MRDIETEIEYSVESDGTINMKCVVPLNEDEVNEFERVLPQGSNFLYPTLDKNSITYTHQENYDTEREAQKRVGNRVDLFKMFVRSRTELTIPCNLKIK